MDQRLGVGLVLALAAGCRGARTASEIEASLRDGARTVVHGRGFTLASPYDEVSTEPYATVITQEVGFVRELLGDEREDPVRLYLVPREEPPGREAWHEASDGTFTGGAFDAGFAFVYVAAGADAMLATLRASFQRDTLRHELTHLCARRVGLVRARWFDEGLATEVASMRESRSGLAADSFPRSLLSARSDARAGSVAELLAWSRESFTRDGEHGRYERAQALLRFLLEREAGGSFLERARSVAALEDAGIAALEGEWLEWLAGLDALAVIRAGVASEDPELRAHAASLLPILAEARAPELATRAAEELAFGLLAAEACRDSAGTFLLFFRARELRESDVERLRDSKVGAEKLVGLALSRRRGAEPDDATIRAAWERLDPSERTSCAAIAAFLGIRDR